MDELLLKVKPHFEIWNTPSSLRHRVLHSSTRQPSSPSICSGAAYFTLLFFFSLPSGHSSERRSTVTRLLLLSTCLTPQPYPRSFSPKSSTSPCNPPNPQTKAHAQP
ncbi:uncharacterized protein BJX67DRAFT_348479 [Aspergillus lucknowensis]|uniref:Uncharacterized protein n=1 Tax=Aspergillus lucknowensis TaxID=176173 RepID=A0ABR4M049_9EURO